MFAVAAVFAAAQTSSTTATSTVKVPDAATAVSLAEKALEKVYGKKHIQSERPFTATLSDGVWHVSGTLYCRDAKGNVTTGTCVGGTAEADIRQSDGRILRVIHTK